MTCRTSKIAIAAAALTVPGMAIPEPLTTISTNTYGNPSNLIDLPTAEMAPDGQLSTSVSYIDGTLKTALTFQIFPRLSGTFRYSGTDDLVPTLFDTYYDRSFDLRFSVVDETTWTPAIAVGLQDFVGTGLQAAEYIVATKSIGERVRVTGGVGWGRLGSYNSFGSTGNRPGFNPLSTGGEFEIDDWFRGDYSFFGGASFAVTDKLTFSAEYSSDAYDQEVAIGIFERKTPWNVGVTYQLTDDVLVSAYSLHGSEFGARINLTLNPKNAPAPGGAEEASVPVAVRAPGTAADLGWTTEPGNVQIVTDAVNKSLDKDGIDLDGIQLSGNTAHVRIRNETYDIQSQALGRTLRNLSRSLPPSVEIIHVTLMARGIPASTMTMRRSDLERLEHAPASQALAAVTFEDTLRYNNFPEPLPGLYPRLEWGLTPYLRTGLFDPAEPLRADVGAKFKAQYDFGSGWFAQGSVAQKIAGNLDGGQRPNNSLLPHVRTDVVQYVSNDTPVIDSLTVAKYFRPAENFYGRVTAGYLEEMYAGVSAEVLWKPVNSRLAFGVEANYVEPREFDKLFGLRSRVTPGGTIPRANGHVSAYYDLGNGFETQVDVGRYLAGDWGATVSLDREFANGWRVGAFATKTNVSAAEFGEGSFDKGIRLTIPLSWALGTPTQKKTGVTIRPITRDGGARLSVPGRLYDSVSGSHQPEIAESWGKFWR